MSKGVPGTVLKNGGHIGFWIYFDAGLFIEVTTVKPFFFISRECRLGHYKIGSQLLECFV
jgi:hypothetical protein